MKSIHNYNTKLYYILGIMNSLKDYTEFDVSTRWRA